MTIRDRIVDLKRIPANELIPNEKNWRTHPESQKNALRGMLEEIGFADAAIAIDTPKGYKLIDGHLRQDIMQDAPIPVLVVDLTEAEADQLLVTLDPLAMMAQSNQEQLLSVLDSINFDSDAVNDMLEALVNGEHQPLPPLYDTGFLDDALDADEEGLPFPTFEPESEAETDHEGLMNFVIRVSPQQRTVIMKAVNIAKVQFLKDQPLTTTEALMEICNDYEQNQKA